MWLLLAATVLLSHLCSLADVSRTYAPRMIFGEKEAAVKKFNLLSHPPVQILLEEQSDTVTAAAQTYLYSYNFRNLTNHTRKMEWEDCRKKDCSYNIILVHQWRHNQLFVCGTNGKETVCCNTNLTEESPICAPTQNLRSMRESIRGFVITEGEHSVLTQSEQNPELYITHSGSKENVGIHKFGSARVRPGNHNKEQHYVGLVLSRRKEASYQDRVYAFYRQKNKDARLFSEMWLPFVAQVCMSDTGGPKNNLQFSWTSQMNARLFCGDHKSKQHFSELVDVATVHADRWQDTKIYALFRNEWAMSAVCVYKIEDIDEVFRTSQFKGYTTAEMDRPRECAHDSTKLPMSILKNMEKTSEMEQLVQPVGNSGLIFKHHNYTHIYIDGSSEKRNSNHVVMFLSLNNGGIHKVLLQNESNIFVIAEYHLFNIRQHFLSIILHQSSKKLYVNTRSELVQLDVANCAQYGNTCQDCILSRDPYCDWYSNRCTPETNEPWVDVVPGNLTSCEKGTTQAFKGTSFYPAGKKNEVSVKLHSNHFLQCPVLSHHAHYKWNHGKNSTSCSLVGERCLYLIDSMGPEHEGTYTCVSEEIGYSKVLAQYDLKVGNRAVGRQSCPFIWVWLMVVLIKLLVLES